MDEKYKKGSYEQLDAFYSYAHNVLPEGIADKAVPEVASIKRRCADGTIAVEPKLYRTAPNVTRIESLGLAFINPNWQWRGYDMAAQELGISKRTLYYWIENGYACRPDVYLGKAWFVPDSYFHLIQ
jgi:hypothetical protein